MAVQMKHDVGLMHCSVSWDNSGKFMLCQISRFCRWGRVTFSYYTRAYVRIFMKLTPHDLNPVNREQLTVSCLLISKLVLEKYKNLVSGFFFVVIPAVCAIMKHLSSCSWEKKFGIIIDVINQHVSNCRIKYSGDTFHKMLRSEGEHHMLTWCSNALCHPLAWN